MKLEKYLNYLVDFIKQTVIDAKCDGVVIGISGGVDSAVVAALGQKAFPNNHLAIWMPIESSRLDLECKNELVNNLKLNTIDIELQSTLNVMKTALPKDTSSLSIANLKARLRMSALYAVGQTKRYLVLGTDNADEWYIGYFTKFGDGGVDVVPLIHLLKKEVKQAAHLLNIPKIIINRAPTASLWENQTDEDEIGFSYDQIDAFLLGDKSDDKLVKRMEYLHKSSEHKRNLAIRPNKFERE